MASWDDFMKGIRTMSNREEVEGVWERPVKLEKFREEEEIERLEDTLSREEAKRLLEKLYESRLSEIKRSISTVSPSMIEELKLESGLDKFGVPLLPLPTWSDREQRLVVTRQQVNQWLEECGACEYTNHVQQLLSGMAEVEEKL